MLAGILLNLPTPSKGPKGRRKLKPFTHEVFLDLGCVGFCGDFEVNFEEISDEISDSDILALLFALDS